MDKKKDIKNKRKQNKKKDECSDSSSCYTSDSAYSSDSDEEYRRITTPAQRLREAIRAKQEDRKKGTYVEKENYDE